MSSKWDNDEVIQRFREYLRIPSVHPDVDYGDCVKFLRKQASLLDLPVVVHEFVPKKLVVVITWEGLQPELPSILLNSHMDVVPVNEEKWTYPPFDAGVTDDGFIYATGTQDMKSISMMHLEAVRKLKAAGVRLKRTVHLTFVPGQKIISTLKQEPVLMIYDPDLPTELHTNASAIGYGAVLMQWKAGPEFKKKIQVCP